MSDISGEALDDAFLAGCTLTSSEVRFLTTRLERNPDDAALRAKALGYYHSQACRSSLAACEPYLREYLWFVAHQPDAGLLTAALLPAMLLGEDAAGEIREAWLARLPELDDNPFALLNASMAVAMTDSARGVAIAQTAARLEPAFAPFLGGQRVRHAMLHGMTPEAAQDALDELRAAAETLDDAGRLEVYGAMAELAAMTGLPVEAHAAAEAVLDLDPGASPFGGDAHHRAHTVLGVLAARDGGHDAAAGHFRASLRVPWSAQASQLGACEDVAEALLNAGHADAVIAAIEDVEADWSAIRDIPWRDRIARGDLPAPLFGRRLFLE